MQNKNGGFDLFFCAYGVVLQYKAKGRWGMRADYWSNVVRYLLYLHEKHGYQIIIKDFIGFLAKETEISHSIGRFISHDNPYCMNLKKNTCLWNRCQAGNHYLQRACKEKGHWFVGSCYCGMAEFVFPVFYKEHVIAAICIGGFPYDEAKNERRCSRVLERFGISAETASFRKDYLIIGKPDYQEMTAYSGIIADYLTLYYSQLLDYGIVREDETYPADATRLYVLSSSIAYIQQNYDQDIHSRDIAQFCRCSISYISHVFMKTMKLSVSGYITQVRLTNAKRLLLEGKESVSGIAIKCGFSDPNYFSYCFHHVEGLTPLQFRNQIQRKGMS